MKTIKKEYILTGVVLGNLWGGGQGYYPAEEIINKTIKGARAKAVRMLNNGLLDSGMGFESLVSAVFGVMEHEVIKENDKVYTRNDYVKDIIIGEPLEDKELKRVLTEVLPSYNL